MILKAEEWEKGAIPILPIERRGLRAYTCINTTEYVCVVLAELAISISKVGAVRAVCHNPCKSERSCSSTLDSILTLVWLDLRTVESRDCAKKYTSAAVLCSRNGQKKVSALLKYSISAMLALCHYYQCRMLVLKMQLAGS